MKKLYVFDFDGCLAETPLPIDGKIMYAEITGELYPHQGWWGRMESMLPEYNIQLHEPLNKIAKEKIETDIVYILTSRLKKFTDRIHDICQKNDFNIARENILTKTNADKGERLFDLATKYLGEIDEIIFYDDREIEWESAEEWREEIESTGVKFTLIKVTSHEYK